MIYTTWTTIATLINFTIVLIHEVAMDPVIAATISYCILAGLLLVWSVISVNMLKYHWLTHQIYHACWETMSCLGLLQVCSGTASPRQTRAVHPHHLPGCDLGTVWELWQELWSGFTRSERDPYWYDYLQNVHTIWVITICFKVALTRFLFPLSVLLLCLASVIFVVRIALVIWRHIKQPLYSDAFPVLNEMKQPEDISKRQKKIFRWAVKGCTAPKRGIMCHMCKCLVWIVLHFWSLCMKCIIYCPGKVAKQIQYVFQTKLSAYPLARILFWRRLTRSDKETQ